jgi:hypothetical protein
MTKVKTARQQIAAAIVMLALALTVAAVDARSMARADTGEPDFLVLNPERE